MPFPRILIVEDFPAFRKVIRSELQQRAEFQVIGEASDGLEAVCRAQELQPDIILIDIGLPTLSGIEAAREIRRLVPDAKLLFVSLESSPAIIEETFRLGGQGYVHKPHAGADLLSAIDAVLEGRRFVSGGLGFKESSPAPSRHEILFCSDDGVVLEALVCFVADALNAGNPAVVWATESHRDSLRKRLSTLGVDVESALRRGLYVASDAYEPLTPARIIETINGLSEAASKGGKKNPQVAVCGERAGQLWANGERDAAIRIEQFYHKLAGSHRIDILCPYTKPAGPQDDPAFQSICAEHTKAISR